MDDISITLHINNKIAIWLLILFQYLPEYFNADKEEEDNELNRIKIQPIHVKISIAWVCCASGNVLDSIFRTFHNKEFKSKNQRCWSVLMERRTSRAKVGGFTLFCSNAASTAGWVGNVPTLHNRLQTAHYSEQSQHYTA